MTERRLPSNLQHFNKLLTDYAKHEEEHEGGIARVSRSSCHRRRCRLFDDGPNRAGISVAGRPLRG